MIHDYHDRRVSFESNVDKLQARMDRIKTAMLFVAMSIVLGAMFGLSV